MPLDPVPSVADSLRRCALLDAVQTDELTQLEAQFPKSRDLVQELMHRGWLTHFQASQVLQGKAPELLLGQYLLMEKIGEGGMGQVYKAKQRNLDRVVALKVIRKECLDNPKVTARFQREIRAAGQLAHPNIVRAFDADQINGAYYIAMEYIDGVDLARLVREDGPLPVEQACDYIRQAALGLQHAHERGLVHRDIKPANLLVGVVRSQEAGVRNQVSGIRDQGSGVKRCGSGARLQGSGVKNASGLRKLLANGADQQTPLTPIVKILDLGLARWEDPASGRASTHLTQMGSVMGTPDFIAPEQARNSHTCDIRADLYSLGCTLYFLIAGRVPFVAGSFAEKLMQHQLDPPEAIASVRRTMMVNFLSRKGKTKVSRKLLPVPDTVVAIVSRLMAKRPEDRWQTPGELAQALELVLEWLAKGSEPKALLPTAEAADATEYEFPPPAPVASTRAAPLVQVASVIGQMIRPGRLSTKRRWLPLGAAAAAVLFALTLAAFSSNSSKPQAGQVPTKDVKLDDDSAWKILQAEVRHKKLPAAELRTKLLAFQRQHPDKARDAAALLQGIASPFDGFDRTKIDTKQWYAWMPDEIVGILGPGRGLPSSKTGHSIAVSTDGRWIIGADGARAVRLWDTGARAIPWSLSNPGWGRIHRVAVAPDACLLATASDDGAARLYDLKNQKLIHSLEQHQRPVTCVAFHPDSTLVASGGNDGFVRLWNTTTGAVQAEVQTGTLKVTALTFSADGKYIFWGGDNQELGWADMHGRTAGHCRYTVNTGPVKVLAFHPGGQSLVCGGSNSTLHVCSWDGHQVTKKIELGQHDKSIHDAAFAADGQTLATVGEDARLILWDVATGAVKKNWVLRAPIHSVAFAPDSRHVLTANANTTIYIFRLTATTAVAQGR